MVANILKKIPVIVMCVFVFSGCMLNRDDMWRDLGMAYNPKQIFWWWVMVVSSAIVFILLWV